jgi:hypothetical protein
MACDKRFTVAQRDPLVVDKHMPGEWFSVMGWNRLRNATTLE